MIMIWRKYAFEGVSYNGLKFHGSVKIRSFFIRLKRIKLEIRKIVFAETGIILQSVEIVDVCLNNFKHRGFYEVQSYEYHNK